MKLDYDSIISCPRCGQQVDIMSLRSYNTVSIDYYSDHQIVEENSTHVSPIQKCPKCGYYYWTYKQPYKKSNFYNQQLGTLSFADLKEASIQIMSESMDKSDEETLCLEIIHAFNDTYFLLGENNMTVEQARIYKEDYEVFRKHALRLIDLMSGDKLFQAELYRECQCFSECISTLEHFQSDKEQDIHLKKAIMNKAEKQDAKVFLVFSRGYTVENGPWPRIRHISPIQPIQSKWKRNPLDVFIAKLLNKFADKLFYE